VTEISYEDLVAGLRARTDLPELAAAAVGLLVWHESWLRRPDFRRACAITSPAGIHWDAAREFYDSNPHGASTSQMIVLEVALAIVEDQHNFRHLGVVHRYRVAEVFAAALGQSLAGPEPVPHNHPEFIPAEGPCPACDRAQAVKLKPLTPVQIADDAIGLFLEYRDQHGHSEDDARCAALVEVAEGAAVTDADLQD
jgi:hypothetical protein